MDLGMRTILACVTLGLLTGLPQAQSWSPAVAQTLPLVWEVAPFEADITIPIGHPCMGGGVADAREILDPLFAKGFVLRPAGVRQPGSDKLGPVPPGVREAFPIVVVALDWCQCNNEADTLFREKLAEAAGTTRQRVLLACVHQHDAPIFDLRAQQLLDEQGLHGWHCDPNFFEEAVQRVARALKEALQRPRRVTHLGIGQAKVEKVASNRKIVTPEGRIHWGRSSASGATYGDYPEGEIDPWLKTLSLWDGEEPVVALSCYAVHPMSYYGKGQVSADFPGMARARRQQDDPRVLQIYFTGCAGDTTAGKYNTGDPANRPVLAERLYRAMREAWENTRRYPLESVLCRDVPLYLPPRDNGDFRVERMREILADAKETRWRRISAALGLSWRERVAAGRPIEVPCLEFNRGQAFFAVLPAETFVGYQLLAQQLRPDSFVVVAGFGDGAPGYIPTEQCWKEGYNDSYCWVATGSEQAIVDALRQVLDAGDRDSAVRQGNPENGSAQPPSPYPRIRQEIIHQELNPQYLWFHPRVAAIPGRGRNGAPRVIVTLQKHLRVSDYYSGLYDMVSDDLGKTWRGPRQIAELDWARQPDGTILAVADVTPGFHPPTGKVLAIGCSVYYGPTGQQLHDRPRFSQTMYAVYEPDTDRWSGWRLLELPIEEKFNLARSACAQWWVEEDGTLFVPIYYAPKIDTPFSVTVLRCTFDSERLVYQGCGEELHLAEARGLCEPSLIKCGGEYYLTLRNDLRGYVTRSKDGLHWQPLRPWTFDDGSELGSYNTQQHWLTHQDALYLVYTRRGAMNDHIPRHRAPLFIAEVDRKRLCVLRHTEQVVLPERGAMMGNFGATKVTDREAWVTVGEYPWPLSPEARPHPKGADGSVLLGRIGWF